MNKFLLVEKQVVFLKFKCFTKYSKDSLHFSTEIYIFYQHLHYWDDKALWKKIFTDWKIKPEDYEMKTLMQTKYQSLLPARLSDFDTYQITVGLHFLRGIALTRYEMKSFIKVNLKCNFLPLTTAIRSTAIKSQVAFGRQRG